MYGVWPLGVIMRINMTHAKRVWVGTAMVFGTVVCADRVLSIHARSSFRFVARTAYAMTSDTPQSTVAQYNVKP